MSLLHIEKNPSALVLRLMGLFFALFFGLIGALAAFKFGSWPTATWLWATGGVLAVATLHTLRRIRGVKRPVLAAIFPMPEGRVVVLDIGANADCRPEHLLQFAMMGDVYGSDFGAVAELPSQRQTDYAGYYEGRSLKEGTVFDENGVAREPAGFEQGAGEIL